MKGALITIFGILIAIIVAALGILYIWRPVPYVPEINFDDAMAPVQIEDDEVEVTFVNTELEPTININLESDIAMTAVAKNGESVTVFTKDVDGLEFVDKIVMLTADGEAGVIEMEGTLPKTFTFMGHKVIFSDFREVTVDLEIVRPDGSRKFIDNTVLNPYGKEDLEGEAFSFGWLIQEAIASEPYVGFEPHAGHDRATYVSSGGEDDGVVSYLAASVGTVLNIITCGISIPAIAASGGTAAPFSYLACGALVTRIVTSQAELGPCEGDIIDCAVNSILSGGPRKGPIIAGRITDAETGEPISGAQLLLRNRQGELQGRGISTSQGFYRLPRINIGGYSLTATTGGYDSEVYTMAFTATDILITDAEDSRPVDRKYSQDDRLLFDKIPGYDGRELDIHHTVRLDIDLGQIDRYDGIWDGSAVNTVDAVIDSSGRTVECIGRAVILNIGDGSVIGTAVTGFGESLGISGSVDGGGKVFAGLASNSVNVVSFDGQLQSAKNVGTGTWLEGNGCTGTFEVTRSGGANVPPASETEVIF